MQKKIFMAFGIPTERCNFTAAENQSASNWGHLLLNRMHQKAHTYVGKKIAPLGFPAIL